MYKIFTLAIMIVVMPLSKQHFEENIITRPLFENPGFCLQYKNTVPLNFWEPEKKTPESWSQNWMNKVQENIRKSEYNFKWEEELNAYCTPNRKNNLRFFYTAKGFSAEPRNTKILLENYDITVKEEDKNYKMLPNWKIQFNLDKRQIGKGKWQILNNKAAYISDKVTVQYINDDEGMRQNFIVQSALSNTHKLQINFNIQTKLKAYINSNRLQFFYKKTNVLNYEQLKVWDATGRVLKASVKKHNAGKNKFYIEVNTQQAVYPLTIDPLSTTPDNTPDDADQANAQFGFSVASAGDVNGDGYSDVIIGAPGFDDGADVDEGRAFVYHGSATGLSASPDSTPDDADQANAQFGISVVSAGDVNGDGYSDVIIGANQYDDGGNSDEGRAFVYQGSAAGLSATPDSTPDDADQANAQFGISVASAGDINGDGYSDVIIGAHQFDDGANNDEGRAFVYYGAASGLGISPGDTPDDADQALAFFGYSVACAGDVNGDGYSDVIIGAYQYDEGANNDEGKVFVYFGSVTGLPTSPSSILGDAKIPSAGFGYSVACAGDVNGDGYSDVIIGAWSYDNGANISEGAAFIYHGSAAGLVSGPAGTLADANQQFAHFGCAVACAGDINGDGYSDVIVGSFSYDDGANVNEGRAFVYNGSATGIVATPTGMPGDADQANAQFGISVASAGDINGDGYSDVIIGANFYDDGGNSDEGRAFVYHGSAAGLSTTPNNTPDDADQANAFFGRSVSSAGDINGDGYSDVIIGAPSFDDGANVDEGRAFVYYGSAMGLSATPNSIPDDADQANTFFGFSVAPAGDINGDGYDDIIIGAPAYDDGANINEGRAFVYYGAAAGLSANPNSIPDDADQANAQFGTSVASAGDINGDGYSDIIIGAMFYDDGANTHEGRAFIYHGSAAGLSASPNSTPDDADQANAQFGFSVASAGDINGDGYSDVIIGAPSFDNGTNVDEGRAFVYYGSATGATSIPDIILDYANQAGAAFGTSVSTAGDVNGDGYSDVIIGAPYYDEGANMNEGRAFDYYGSSTGLPTVPNNIPDNADQAGALFGFRVAAAGDVNGDGYSDVIIGAQSFTDGANSQEGRAFVYHGAATGLSATPNSTHGDADQPVAWFSSGLGSAGDINGDGYSDIIIGAQFYDDGASSNEGRAFVYNGNDYTSNRRNNLRLYNADLTTPINSSNFIFGNFGAGLYAKSFLGRSKGKLVWETRLNYNAYSGMPITNSTLFTAQQAAYTDMGLTGVEIKNQINKLLGGRYTKLRARIKYDPVSAITGQVYSPWRNVSSIIDANNLGILPTELISFKAAWLQKGKTARLDFTTEKESGTCCFDIEKSVDGFYFYTIGTLPARNNNGIQSYSFIDGNASSKNQFYRLKIKGIAGQVDYSNIQQLRNKTTAEILVFPNPTTDVLQLKLNNAFDKMNVQIVNSVRQVVKKISIPASNQSITIPVQNLVAGKYWIYLQSGNDKQVIQFVKQ